MWFWRSVLCVSLVCGLALDSNTIRSSKETAPQSSELPVERANRRRTEMNSNRRATSACSDCDVPQRGGCSNRAQRTPSVQNRHQDTDERSRDGGFNATKAQEMSTCVRSRDCAEGLCCARYLNRKVCLRIPGEGEACQLRGANKGDRKLGRCPCAGGLSCTASSRADSPRKSKNQGVCRSRPQLVQRKKKRRTTDSQC